MSNWKFCDEKQVAHDLGMRYAAVRTNVLGDKSKTYDVVLTDSDNKLLAEFNCSGYASARWLMDLLTSLINNVQPAPDFERKL